MKEILTRNEIKKYMRRGMLPWRIEGESKARRKREKYDNEICSEKQDER